MRFNKKGQVLDQLGDLLVVLGTIAILAGIIFLIIGESKTVITSINPCENSSLIYNASAERCQYANASLGVAGLGSSFQAVSGVQSAASDIPGWFPIVVITIIGGILLTLVRFFKK